VVDKCVDVNAKDDTGTTPLHTAAEEVNWM